MSLLEKIRAVKAVPEDIQDAKEMLIMSLGIALSALFIALMAIFRGYRAN